MKEKVLDLAQWNPVSDYGATKADGINNVILKAINKSNNSEKAFETHYKGCKGSDINILGTYHYSYSDTVIKAKASAEAWVKTINDRNNKFFLDWEDSCLPKNAVAVDIILAYADMIQRYGYDFNIYCGYSWYNSYLKKYAKDLPFDFWIARYPVMAVMEDEQDPNDKYKPSITNNMCGWQYTSKCKVDGISGTVDSSVWYEDLTEGNKVTETVPIDFNPYTEPTRTLRLHAVGEDVKWLQWYLYRFGLLLGNDGLPSYDEIDGKFGNKTLLALTNAQRILGIDADGVCGQITRTTFKKIC